MEGCSTSFAQCLCLHTKINGVTYQNTIMLTQIAASYDKKPLIFADDKDVDHQAADRSIGDYGGNGVGSDVW